MPLPVTWLDGATDASAEQLRLRYSFLAACVTGLVIKFMLVFAADVRTNVSNIAKLWKRGVHGPLLGGALLLARMAWATKGQNAVHDKTMDLKLAGKSWSFLALSDLKSKLENIEQTDGKHHAKKTTSRSAGFTGALFITELLKQDNLTNFHLACKLLAQVIEDPTCPSLEDICVQFDPKGKAKIPFVRQYGPLHIIRIGCVARVEAQPGYCRNDVDRELHRSLGPLCRVTALERVSGLP